MRADDVPIEGPCDEDWDRMRPEDGGRRRWCEHCERQVHDLSKMGEPAARAFLQATAGLEVCVAYDQDERGAIVFAARAIVPLERLRRAPRAPALEATKLASAASLAVLLAACTPHDSGRGAVIVSDPVEVAAAPEVVIPTEAPELGGPEQPPAIADPEQTAEPCEPEPKAEPRVMPRMKGKRKRLGSRVNLPDDDPLGGL